ncbi:MAG: hypothetical protein J5I90_17915 [Caldilineales bacterium]|nr:hypothetical protein [Caldilineales bacterium]
MSALSNVWSTLSEFDVAELRGLTAKLLRVAILGSDVAAMHWLADELAANPYLKTQTPASQTMWLYALPASEPELAEAAKAEMAFIVLAADGVWEKEQAAFARLRGIRPDQTVVVVQMLGAGEGQLPTLQWNQWRGARLTAIDPRVESPLQAEFIPTLLSTQPDQMIRLAHFLPALCPAVSAKLIKDTCVTNASYSAATGVAEMVPVLNIPLNAADMIILSKNQALLTYKLALALGHNSGIQEMIAPIAGVLGAGFVWRQLARTLVGFIPGIGIVPKIAIAYAGTYVVGKVAFAWYAHGEELTGERMQALYREALVEGRDWAAAHLPKERPSLPRPKLPSPALPRRTARRCPQCSKRLRKRDQFCSSCGYDLTEHDLTPTIEPENALT